MTRTSQTPRQSSKALQTLAEEAAALEIDFINHEEFSNSGSSERLEAILVAEYENKRLPKAKPSPELPAFFTQLYETPLLTPDEEHDLFWAMNYLKYRANLLKVSLDTNQPDELLISQIQNCLKRSHEVRERIVKANLRLVVSLARKFCSEHSTFDELVSDGNVVVIKASEKFDCSRGFRFSTYATHAIQRDFYRQIERRRKNAQRITGGQNEFLGEIGFEIEEVNLPVKMQSLLFQKLMEVFQGELDEREQHIVSARYGINEQESGQTLRSVAERLGISKERVRQLQMSAIGKLKDILVNQLNVFQQIDDMTTSSSED